MATIHKRKKGKCRWEYTIQVLGHQERKRFETKEECEAALAARHTEVRDARITGIVAKSLEEVAQHYLAFKAARGKRSLTEDREILETRLLPFFGKDTTVSAITTAMIARYQMHHAVAVQPRIGRPISASTINRHLSILRGLLRLAKKWGHLRDVPEFEMLQEPEGRLRYLDQAEAVRLLDVCRQSRNPYLHAIVTIGLHAGLRQGEILGLTWDRVDFARGVLLLDKTKSGKRREVPMSQAVYTVLTALPGYPREGAVFRTGSDIRTAFGRALRRAKITAFRFHDLRHTCASWLVMEGRPLLEVKELLGHATISMTMRYAHLAPERLRDAVSVLDRVFAAPVRSEVEEVETSGGLAAAEGGARAPRVTL